MPPVLAGTFSTPSEADVEPASMPSQAFERTGTRFPPGAGAGGPAGPPWSVTFSASGISTRSASQCLLGPAYVNPPRPADRRKWVDPCVAQRLPESKQNRARASGRRLLLGVRRELLKSGTCAIPAGRCCALPKLSALGPAGFDGSAPISLGTTAGIHVQGIGHSAWPTHGVRLSRGRRWSAATRLRLDRMCVRGDGGPDLVEVGGVPHMWVVAPRPPVRGERGRR